MTTHTITLARHTAQVVGLVGLVGVLVLGTWDSYGTEQLLLRPGPEWEGLAIDATFHNVPNDEGVTVLADTDGLVPVPPEACIQPSRCATITIRGVQDGVQRISCNLPYVVLDHAQVPGANSTATPSENAQALAQMQDLRDGAVDAKNQAEAARDDAARSAAAAKESETNAGQSATAAKTAQSAAETAKAGAETAQKAAASSASSASTSASTATTQAAAAKSSADAAASSATAAKASEAAAGKSAKEAAASESAAKAAQTAAETAKANADTAASNAAAKATAAAKSAVAAKESETSAGQSATAAANSATAAAGSATAAAGDAKTASDAAAGAAAAKAAAVAAQKDAAASKAAAANSSAAAKTSEDAAAKSAADADSTANSIKESMTQIAALQKRQNVLVGSETGNPIAVDDAFAAPLCGLNVYGKSTQDGTPSPDTPVPIVSAGDGGSVAVKVTGKNRMPPNLKRGNVVECFVKKNTPITLVFKGDFVSQGGNILFIGENNENLWFGIDAGKAEHHITLKANATKFQYLLNNTASENVCLTWNASSPDYEPYREQLLTLPTPNGLPGIPVTSGGNYTDQNGQQWVCDEVDLERGVKVQRITTIVFSDKKKFALRTTNTSTKFRFSSVTDGLKPANLMTADSSAFCSALALGIKDSTWTIPNTFTIGSDVESGVNLYVRFENINSLDELRQYLQRTPMSLTAILATPIETPLTPAEIAAYKALTAYAPDTVVQASDGAGVKLEYQRDANIAIKKLEDAIASMTAT